MTRDWPLILCDKGVRDDVPLVLTEMATGLRRWMKRKGMRQVVLLNPHGKLTITLEWT